MASMIERSDGLEDDLVKVKLSLPEQARALFRGGTLDAVEKMKISRTQLDFDFWGPTPQQVTLQDGLMVAVADYLTENTSVKRLEFACYIDEFGLRIIAQALKINTSLEFSILSLKGIGKAGMQALAEMLEANTTLKALSLTAASLSNDGMIALSKIVKANTHCKIEVLDFATNRDVKEAGWMALADALASNRTVKMLGIDCTSSPQMDAAASVALIKSLGNIGTLQKLDIQESFVPCDSVQAALGQVLASNHSIVILILSYNRITAAGCTAIAEALKKNTVLTDLDFAGNLIDDTGALAIGQALASNHSITRLNISSNSFEAVGCTAIAEALKKNSTLTHLDMSVNSIGDAGAQALAKALPSNTTLEILRLTWLDISEVGARALGNACGDMAHQEFKIKIDDFMAEPEDTDEEERWDECDRVMREAKAQRGWKRRTEQLVVFGMGLHHRLGGAGGGGLEQGGGELSFNIVGPISVMNLIEQPRFKFHGMTPDIFKLVGEAYDRNMQI